MNSHESADCEGAPRSTPPVDPSIAAQSQRFFTSVRADTYRCVHVREKDLLALPWGPMIDVLFDPKGAPGIVGGTVRLMARTAGTEIQIASATITDPNAPISLSGECGCDEYVVKASLGSDPGPMVRRIESYVFARVYSGV